MSDLTAERLAVLDEETVVRGFLRSSATFSDYPRPPARSSNEFADALGVFVHYETWGLVLGRLQLKYIGDAIATLTGLSSPAVAGYILRLTQLCHVSGGAIVQPPIESRIGSGVPPDVVRATTVAAWADVDALVLSGLTTEARSRGGVQEILGGDVWVPTARAIADKAPFIS